RQETREFSSVSFCASLGVRSSCRASKTRDLRPEPRAPFPCELVQEAGSFLSEFTPLEINNPLQRRFLSSPWLCCSLYVLTTSGCTSHCLPNHAKCGRASCPDLVHIGCLLSSLFGKVERSKQTVYLKSGHEANSCRVSTRLEGTERARETGQAIAA